jgi:peptidylprolyl isomerase
LILIQPQQPKKQLNNLPGIIFNMKRKLIFTLMAFCIVSLTTVAQLPKKIKKNVEYTTETGLKIKFLTINKGNQPQKGDLVKVDYRGKLTNDTVFDESYKRGEPFSFKLGMGKVIPGWDEGIALMHKGDKAILTIPAALGYGERDMGVIPPNSILIFEVELHDFTEAPKPYDVKGKDTISTGTGLKYIMVSKGNGIKVVKGMNVTVNYTGYFEDGKIFDSSVERNAPIKIPIGEGKVIPGWDEGITLLSVGDKARLLIPYTLAYGEKVRGPIPAKSNLIFDVEVIKAEQSVAAVAYDVKGKDTLSTASGLKYIEVKAGTGIPAKSGSKVKVHYTGYFSDGSIFDSSVERGEPFEFTLGMGSVIAGWDEGVALMKTGGKTRFIIPYTLGYGENAYGPIPAKSTLIFDVELLEVN